MYLNDNNDQVPLYDTSMNVAAGAGDLFLEFTGFDGSSFENCDVTYQTLTRGSQYQTSFLPEMTSGLEYKVKVKATYKDFQPITYSLNVKYLPNLDGKTKFIDLGTHIFYKNTTSNLRPSTKYQFLLNNVIDHLEDDDRDDYDVSISDGLKSYFRLEDQENLVTLGAQDAKTIPHVGENYIKVSSDQDAFVDSERRFFTLPGMDTNVEVPLVSKLQDGELAVVLTWTQGATISGNNAILNNLDLHIEFQTSSSVLCQIDFAQRQCSGVKLTTDSAITDGKITQIQAAKFDKIGDFNYMVYASRSQKSVVNAASLKNAQIQASLQIFAPRHSGPVYEVDMPFFNQDQKESFWVGFCLRGGRGINFSGVSVSDPSALFMSKPKVNQQCILDKQNIPTIGISQPTNVQIKTVTYELVDITWEEPTQTGGQTISHYRVFVTDKDNTASSFNFETRDFKTSYQLKTPKVMQGKAFIVTVQAINKNQKMSLVSEPAIFTVSATGTGGKKGTNSFASSTSNALPAPITDLTFVVATSKKIQLTWTSVTDAKDYKVYWDRGNPQQTSLFYPLASSTNGSNAFTADTKTAGASYFGTSLYNNGGVFNFKVSYISTKTGNESELSQAFQIKVPAKTG